MNYNRRFTYHLLVMTGLLSLLCSCHQPAGTTYTPPNFSTIKNADVTVIGNENIIYPFTWSMQIKDSTIIMSGLLDGKWVHSYNRFSGKPISSHIRNGEGPDEIISSSKTSFAIDSNYYKTFDEETQKIKFYDKEFNFVNQYTPGHSKVLRVTDVYFLPDDRYLLQAFIDKGYSALTIVREGQEGNLYTVTPVDNSIDITLNDNTPNLRKLYRRTRSALSPDATKMVCTTISGAYMEIFDIDNLTLVPKVTRYMYPFEVETNGNLQCTTSNSTQGFSAVYATNSRIIGAFLGHTDLMGPSDITVWDWNGNPLRKYKTNYQIIAMTPSPDSPDDIYALGGTKNGEIHLLLFHCPGLLE